MTSTKLFWKFRPSLKGNNCVHGQVLAELLVAIAVGITLAAIGAQLVGVSLKASQSSKSQSEALGLAQEALEAIRVIVRSNDVASQGWNKIYLPPDGTGNAVNDKGVGNPYHPEVVGGEWKLISGSDQIPLSGVTYDRSVIIENVSRDLVTREIETVYNSARDDPSTQKATVIISRSGVVVVEMESFFTRYLNTSTPQTDWSGVINDGPFSAQILVNNPGSGTDSASILDRTNSACSGAAQCVRLEPQ